MKKILSILIISALLMSSLCLNVFADDDIKIVIDGVAQQYDRMPVIKNSRTLVPLRGIFEALGAKVSWDGNTQTIIGAKDSTTIVLQVNNSLATIGSSSVTLDAVPEIMSDRTMVPVRFISEALGAEVLWDDDTRTVTINSPKKVAETTEDGEKVVIDWRLFKGDSKLTAGAYGKLEFADDVLNVKVTTLPEKDSSVNITLKTPLTAIKAGDVCLMSFKAKVNSGTDGYIKALVQTDKESGYKKSLFARTKLSSEWQDCYLPFVGVDNLGSCVLRFGGSVQDISVKDFKIVNYKNTKTYEALPSTIIK